MSRKLEKVPDLAGTVRRSGVVVRTLGLAFVAAGAVAASVLIGRSRHEQSGLDIAPTTPADGAPPALELDAIRAAGL